MAAGKGRLNIIRFLLEYETDKLLGGGTNETDALVCACGKSHPEVVKYFVEKGFDVRSVSSGGRTPLHAAAEGERPDIMELLVHHGAVLDVTDQAGNTPLHLISQKVSKLAHAGSLWRAPGLERRLERRSRFSSRQKSDNKKRMKASLISPGSSNTFFNQDYPHPRGLSQPPSPFRLDLRASRIRPHRR